MSKKRSKNKKGKRFGEKEFVKDLWAVMEKQAKGNPAIALLHRRLDQEIPMKLVGLTGGIASGKSLVVSYLKKRKIPVIEADLIAHGVIQPLMPAYQAIVSVFGDGILNADKTINRKALGEIVFSHPEKRKTLESITHPEILKRIQEEVTKSRKKKAGIVVIDAPLLFESGLDREMDLNILVRIKPEIQLKRLMKRDKITEKEAWPRILAQIPSSKKETRVDFIIDNSGSRKKTEAQLLRIWNALMTHPDRDHLAP